MSWQKRHRAYLRREQRRSRPAKVYRRCLLMHQQYLRWRLTGAFGRCDFIQRDHVERQRGVI